MVAHNLGRIIWSAMAACVLLAAAGCSSHAEIFGDATYNGEPIDDGAVTFMDQSGKIKFPCAIKDGKYKFEKDRGPAPGKYRVEIVWMKKSGKKVPTGDGDPRDERVQALPDKFNTQSTLSAEVKSGSQKLDFNLRSDQ
jgi:hypothetical protein